MILRADARAIPLADRSVQCVVTSPPYWGLRSYAGLPDSGSRVGDLVLDPFIGSGTVGKVCERLGRRWVGLDLSAEYIEIAKRRTAQRGLFAREAAAVRA